jgi:uncharacterized protein (DUF58 family)
VARGRVAIVLWGATTLVALATGHVILLRLSYALAALVVISGLWAWTSIKWVRIGRRTRASRAQVGDVAEESFSVRNRGALPKLWLEVRDDSNLPGHHASRVVHALGPGSERRWTVRTYLRRRGRYVLGPVRLVSGDPLGMFHRERDLSQSTEFLVYPRTLPLRDFDLAAQFLPGSALVRHRAQFSSTDVRSVREYRPGDPYSRIHWPTTARRGRIHVKEFEFDPTADVWIALDMQGDVHTGEASILEPDLLFSLGDRQADVEIEPTTEEYAVTAAASLARHLLEQNRSVGLITYAQRRDVVGPDRGERQLHKILTDLAVVRARGRTPLSQVLAGESTRFSRNTGLLVVTPSAATMWVEGLRILRHRGVRSTVVLLEASTFGPASGCLETVALLAASNIPTFLLKKGSDIALSLSGMAWAGRPY